MLRCRCSGPLGQVVGGLVGLWVAWSGGGPLGRCAYDMGGPWVVGGVRVQYVKTDKKKARSNKRNTSKTMYYSRYQRGHMTSQCKNLKQLRKSKKDKTIFLKALTVAL